MFYVALLLVYFLSMVYMEVFFHALHFSGFDGAFVYSMLMVLFYAGIFTVLSSIGKKTIRKVVSFVLTGAMVLYFMVNHIYCYVFKMYLSAFSVMTGTGGIVSYYREIIAAVEANIVYLLLYLIPIAIMIAFWIVVDHTTFVAPKLSVLKDWNDKFTVAGITLAVFFTAVSLLPLLGSEMYSPYDLYHYAEVPEMSVGKLGLFTTSRMDIKHLVWGQEEKPDVDEDIDFVIVNYAEETAEDEIPAAEVVVADTESVKPADEPSAEEAVEVAEEEPAPPEPIVYEPNILNVDFDELINEAKNKDLAAMHEYFKNNHVTYKNKYTGMFEGYNFIMLTAEGFSPYAVHEDITPTLYKLTHEGFIFTDFYTPIWGTSTTDGEYVACTGLIPKSGVWSFYRTAQNDMPFAFGNQFRRLGYSTRAYHDHTFDYYCRDESHPNMGYDYKGLGNGLNIKKTWPESDLEMMEVTAPEYVNDEPFHTYYMTVSGHLYYTFTGNSMSHKNREFVKDLPYDEGGQAYIACNIELDRALESLINSLKEAGVLERTVIALSADHYPYGLDKSSMDMLAGHEVEGNFELYRNHFILWNSEMGEPIVVDKPACSMDIVPTISNLFGLEYDSRLHMGQDILSDESDGLVVFANRSFITDKVRYNAVTKEAEVLVKEPLPENYIKNMSQKVSDMFKYSAKIIDYNYYQYFKNAQSSSTGAVSVSNEP